MKRSLSLIFTLVLILGLVACENSKANRELILDGQKVSEKEVGGFTSWLCYDEEGEELVVEIGYYNDPSLEGEGFVLFNGSDRGVEAFVSQKGLDQMWFWDYNENDELFDYLINLESDNTGYYYDFSRSKPDEKVDPSQVFKCRPKK